MKRNGFTLLNLIILGLGILFIVACRRPDFIHSLVFFTGIAFLVPGVINIVTLLSTGGAKEEESEGTSSRHHEKKSSVWQRFTGWAVSIAAVALGAMMCFTPEAFRIALIYIFACFILIAGIYHFYMLARGMRPVSYPAWAYLFPTALTAIAFVLVLVPSLRDDTAQHTVALLTGSAMIIFAVTSFFESIGLRAYNKRVSSPTLPEAAHDKEEATETKEESTPKES
ncbi:MAG: hypothetical protein HDS77_03335 [Bacteroidales bacterium]|nr:hypothetical protein [Bacteroidales bacterium]